MQLNKLKGDQHSEIVCYSQSWKVPGSNLTDVLGWALRPNLIMRHPVTLGSNKKLCSDERLVSKTAPSSVTHIGTKDSQITDKKDKNSNLIYYLQNADKSHLPPS